MRARAEELLDAQAPTLLFGSPMCTAFSTWQFINNKQRDLNIFQAEKKVRASALGMDVQALRQAGGGWKAVFPRASRERHIMGRAMCS